MSVFDGYSRYYDLLYGDKDYGAEADFVAGLLSRFHPEAFDLLELGCGSGGHAAHLATRGFGVHGIDISSPMLERAEERRASLGDGIADRIVLEQGDVRSVRVGRTFAGVISLFHVMSYQATNDDLRAAFATAREHLEPGGVFLFDCWYGPAVLTDRPQVRVKRFRGSGLEVTRIAEPTMHPNECVVDVHYTVLIRDLESGETHELEETHRMRYLFQPEVQALARSADFEPVHASEWMGDGPLGEGSWSACFVLKAGS